MKKNMGTIDRIIRTAIAAVAIVLILTGQVTGTVAVVLGIVAIVFLLTSLLGWCPIYVPLGISTRKEEK